MSATLPGPKPSNTLQGSDLGDEYLFYDRAADRLHVLNGTAREIYLLCDGTRTIEAIARELVDRFGIAEDTARHDAETTIRECRELGLLVG